ncbi:hypothetical protein ACWFOS_01190 [Gordonia terrae]
MLSADTCKRARKVAASVDTTESEWQAGRSKVVRRYLCIEHVVAQYARCLASSGKSPKQALFALDFIGDTAFACYLGVESWRARDDGGVSGFEQVEEVVDRGSINEPNES